MLQITPQMKILVAVEPVDFRRGIDGLARLCQDSLRADGTARRLAAHQLAVLLSAGDPTRTGAAADWRPVGPLT